MDIVAISVKAKSMLYMVVWLDGNNVYYGKIYVCNDLS